MSTQDKHNTNMDVTVHHGTVLVYHNILVRFETTSKRGFIAIVPNALG